MTTQPARPQTVGMSGATPISVDVTHLYHAAPVRVQLTANYTVNSPPGYPARPDFTGSSAKTLDRPGVTYASGTILHLLGCEATALINAGVAVAV
jgi:hypothetical protein